MNEDVKKFVGSMLQATENEVEGIMFRLVLDLVNQIKTLEYERGVLESRFLQGVVEDAEGWHVTQIPEFSTAHVTKKDVEILSKTVSPWIERPSGPDAPGIIVYVGGPREEDYECVMSSLLRVMPDLSSVAVNLFRKVAKAGYFYLRLDRDAPVYDSLETVDW